MNAAIAYAARTNERPRYYANDHGRDRVPVDTRTMALIDGRSVAPVLDSEGFALVAHRSAVDVFDESGSSLYAAEVVELVSALSGADTVIVAAPGVLRFAERSERSGALNNSRPARFAHVDISDTTALRFAERSRPAGPPMRRFAHFNVWRAISEPPQDVPLAVCDARSTAIMDLITADAIFDEPGKPDWSFEGLVVAYNPLHRWHWFPDMTRAEALVFKTHDSAPGPTHCVPHVAFDNPCPPDTPPRASIEMRAIAYWHG